MTHVENFSFPKQAFGKRVCSEIANESCVSLTYEGGYNGFTNVSLVGTMKQVKMAKELLNKAINKHVDWKKRQAEKKARSRATFSDTLYPPTGHSQTTHRGNSTTQMKNIYECLEVDDAPESRASIPRVQRKFVPIETPENLSSAAPKTNWRSTAATHQSTSMHAPTRRPRSMMGILKKPEKTANEPPTFSEFDFPPLSCAPMTAPSAARRGRTV